MDTFTSAETFLRLDARLLEQRLFDAAHRGGPPGAVVDALRGYQNDDGGFGYALEPDTRCPASLPIYVETALQALAAAGVTDVPMVERACDYLARTAAGAGAGGAVALASPVIERYPRAEHWAAWTYRPGLNPTAGLVGLLHQLGADHPWRAAATEYCWQQLDQGVLPDDAHALSEVLVFLAHVPEPERAERHAVRVAQHLRGADLYHADPEAPGYGLTPLTFAPLATSRWRPLFDDAVLGAHLDHLLRSQQEDGGWPISWQPPGPAATLEWRGVVTCGAVRTLASYGRITVPDGGTGDPWTGRP